jgi:hypothetical protein
LGHSLLARPLLAYLPAIRVTLFLPVVVVVVVVVAVEVVMLAIALMVAMVMIIITFHVILLFIFIITKAILHRVEVMIAGRWLFRRHTGETCARHLTKPPPLTDRSRHII